MTRSVARHRVVTRRRAAARLHWLHRLRRSAAAGLAAVAIGAFTPVAAGAAPVGLSATAGCDLYAAPTGDDAASGATLATAKRSPIALLAALRPGQTGCLADGANFVLGPGAAITSAQGTPTAPKTLRPATPGARATITTASGFWIRLDAHDLVLRDLDIRRDAPAGSSGSLMMVDGDRITLDGVDLTYPHNICLDVGDDARAGATDPTEDFVLRRSRVHDCGSAYGPPRTTYDSGVHGIYLQLLRDGADADEHGAILEDNVIVRNHNRGVQLYPDADDVLIQHNVIAHNGANVNLGSAGTIASERNTVVDNVIWDAALDGLEPGGFVGDTAEVLGNYAVVANPANRVERNCVGNPRYPGHIFDGRGFTRVDNIENVDPRFVDAPGDDYRLSTTSPCLGKGPRQLPTADPCTVRGTSGADVLTGTPGDDVLCGLGGNDVLIGLGGDDVLIGGDGNDTLRPGAGDDRLDGGAGRDTLDVGDATASVSVNLLGGNDLFCSAGAACSMGYDTFVDDSLENVAGSAHADTIIGDGRVNVLNGRGGADIVDGQRGADRLLGGGGPDILVGRDGADTIEGGAGNDALYGGAGYDVLLGGDGTDRCAGEADGASRTGCEA